MSIAAHAPIRENVESYWPPPFLPGPVTKLPGTKAMSLKGLCPIFSVPAVAVFSHLLSETVYQSMLDHKPSLCDPQVHTVAISGRVWQCEDAF